MTGSAGVGWEAQLLLPSGRLKALSTLGTKDCRGDEAARGLRTGSTGVQKNPGTGQPSSCMALGNSDLQFLLKGDDDNT